MNLPLECKHYFISQKMPKASPIRDALCGLEIEG